MSQMPQTSIDLGSTTDESNQSTNEESSSLQILINSVSTIPFSDEESDEDLDSWEYDEANRNQISTTQRQIIHPIISNASTSGVEVRLYLTPEQYYNLLNGVNSEYSFQGQPPASQKALLSLNVSNVESVASKSCGICLELFTKNEKISTMPCNHDYHQSCLEKWLKHSNTCPECRYEIETDNSDYNRGVSERMAKRKCFLKIDDLPKLRPDDDLVSLESPLKKSRLND